MGQINTTKTKLGNSKTGSKAKPQPNIQSKDNRRSNSFEPKNKNADSQELKFSKKKSEILESASKLKGQRKQIVLSQIESQFKLPDEMSLEDSSDEDFSEPSDFASDEDSGDSDNYEPFVPRRHMIMFKEAYGKDMKVKKGNPTRFTKGTNPMDIEKIKFVMAENWGCPSFLPMLDSDALVTDITIIAASHDPQIPISEHIRKEFFYKASTTFHEAVKADPTIFADEIRERWVRLDHCFGTVRDKTPEQRLAKQRFTQGDYRRFCAVLYLFTRKMFMMCVLMMERDRKKRVMPKHIATSMV